MGAYYPDEAGIEGKKTKVISLLGHAKIVSLFTVISQLVAFVRTAIIASLFGASSLVDSYNLALVAPILLSGVIVGWLQAGFVGRYMEHRRNPDPAPARAFRGSISMVVLAIALGSALLIFAGRDFLTALLVPETSVQTRLQTDAALVIAAWSLIPTVMSDYIGLVLNCHSRFLASAAAPVVNALVSAAALWFWPEQDLDALLWTLLLGWIVQLGIVVASCARAGLSFVPGRSMMGADVRATLLLGLPILPAVVFSNGTVVVIQISCSRLGEGAVALYGYASKLHGALTQVMIVGISTVLLPHLAGMLADNQRKEIKILFSRITRASLLTSIFVLSGVLTLGEPAIMALLGRGKFDQTLAASVSDAWSILSLSLLPFALATFYAKLFQAMRQPILLSNSALISLLVTGVACYVGQVTLGLNGVMLAPLAAQVAVMLFFLAHFRKNFGRDEFPTGWFRTIGLSCLLVFPSLLVDWGIHNYLLIGSEWMAFSLRAVLFVSVFLLAVRVTGALSWVLREDAS